MYYDKLKNQKKIISKEMKMNIFVLICGLYFFILFFAAGFASASAFLFLPFPLISIFLSIKWITVTGDLLKQFSSIEKNGTLNKTYTLKLCSPKVRFLRFPNAGHSSFSPPYYGISLDDGKHRYYYYFNEILMYEKNSFNEITKKFDKNIVIKCYHDTFIIKTIENDPLFVRIRYGEYCE